MGLIEGCWLWRKCIFSKLKKWRLKVIPRQDFHLWRLNIEENHQIYKHSSLLSTLDGYTPVNTYGTFCVLGMLPKCNTLFICYRSGMYCYHPQMHRTCCPQYMIRCDVTNFKITKNQKKVIKKFNRFVRGHGYAAEETYELCLVVYLL
mgnify:CR=1 FL=1